MTGSENTEAMEDNSAFPAVSITAALLILTSGLLVVYATFALGRRIGEPLYREIMHLRTRKVAPKRSQVWTQDGAVIIVRAVRDDEIVLRTSRAVLRETPEEWEENVRRFRRYLVIP